MAIILIHVASVIILIWTSFWVGRYFERTEWNRLIHDGQLPRPAFKGKY